MDKLGKELLERARVEHIARQNVRAHLGAFFDHAHVDRLAVVGLLQLLELDGRCQASGPRAHDDHVEIHALPRWKRRGKQAPGETHSPRLVTVKLWSFFVSASAACPCDGPTARRPGKSACMDWPI